LKSEKEKVRGLVITRMQERKEVEKGANKERKGKEQLANRSKEKKKKGV